MYALGFLAAALLPAACVPDPTAPARPDVAPPAAGVLAVNEGLWRRDNATITLYNPADSTAVQDYFAARNPGERLGDLANDVEVRGGLAYIAVSTSETIEVIACGTGRSAGRLRLPTGNQPRRLAFIDSTRMAATCFGDSLTVFDPRTLRLDTVVRVGPAPEGVAVAEGAVFVANSGLGNLRASEPRAGTITVLDARTFAMRNEFSIGPDPRDIIAVPVLGRLYVLVGLPDSLGWVVELDPRTLGVTRRWEVHSGREMAIDQLGLICYVVGSDGLLAIDLAGPLSAPRTFVPASAWPATIFYSVGCAPNGDVYLGTVRDYASPGEVLIFGRDGGVAGRFACGLNPGSFGFY